jgi:uncharacterized protein YutE (UPF0331/DUF86 family)
MVISKLNIDKIARILSLIQECIAEMKRLSMMQEEEFLSDKRNPAAGESYLRRSLEAMFDVGRHILAKSYGFKDLEYKKIAIELGEKGVVEEEYSRILMKMAGYRNRMVHLYQEIGPEEIYDILKNHISDIEQFVGKIASFIDTYKKEVNDKESAG